MDGLLTFTPANVRRSHIRTIFHLLSSGQRLSRAELGRRTGLSRTGMSQVAQAMLEAGLVRELDRAEAGRKGRQGVPLTIDRSRLRVMAFDLTQHGRIDGTLSDLMGTPVAHRMMVLDGKRTATGNDVCSLADELLREAQGCQLVAVGTAVRQDGGDWNAGDWSMRIPRTDAESGSRDDRPRQSDMDLQRTLEQELGLPANVLDDAMARLIAERAISLRPTANMLMATIDDDVRAAIDLCSLPDHNAWIGGRETHIGDIGHITLDRQGPPCPCGKRGCLTRLIDTHALTERLRQSNAQERTVLLRRAGTWLGQALAPIAGLLSIADVRVQGDSAVVNGTFLTAVQEYLDEACASPYRPRAVVKRASNGPETVIRGAALGAVDSYLNSL